MHGAIRQAEQFTALLEIRTRGKGLYPFTGEVAAWVASCGVETGLLTLFCQHTSASLVIQENADPDVVLDLADFFERLAPEDDPHYRHTTEGADDMPAHIRAALTQTQLDDSGDRRPHGAGHLAGNLFVRAPQLAPSAQRGAAPDRRIERSRALLALTAGLLTHSSIPPQNRRNIQIVEQRVRAREPPLAAAAMRRSAASS